MVVNLAPLDGELYLIKQLYRQPESDLLIAQLYADLAWQEEAIFIYGRWVKVARLTCWCGDSDAWYRYSGVNHQPMPWMPALQAIREKAEQQCQCVFNSALANLYRDGNDSINEEIENAEDQFDVSEDSDGVIDVSGWHQDR